MVTVRKSTYVLDNGYKIGLATENSAYEELLLALQSGSKRSFREQYDGYHSDFFVMGRSAFTGDVVMEVRNNYKDVFLDIWHTGLFIPAYAWRLLDACDASLKIFSKSKRVDASKMAAHTRGGHSQLVLDEIANEKSEERTLFKDMRPQVRHRLPDDLIHKMNYRTENRVCNYVDELPQNTSIVADPHFFSKN